MDHLFDTGSLRARRPVALLTLGRVTFRHRPESWSRCSHA